MANPGDFAYTLKQQADIVRIVGEYITLRKAGAQNFSGLCPFHQEKTPSFSVHASRQFFHCFGCGASGDVFSFVQKIENITFPEAIRLIAEKLKVPMPKMSFSSPEEERAARMRGGLIDIHERACAFFQEQLRKPEGAPAREYLASRGITPAILAEFRMGFAPDSGFLLRETLRGQWSEELLRESGLFSWKDKNEGLGARGQGSERDNQNTGATSENQPLAPNPYTLATIYSKFRNRVMFPICNETGKVIAFTGRTLSTDEKAGPKYLNSPETPIYSKSRVLFNLDKAREAIRKLDYAILVEGQMDCIAVYTAGFHNVIASSGTAFTELQARLIGRFTKNVVVNFDPDTAGAAAAERSLALLVSEDFQIKVLTLEAGFDPDLYIRRKGAAAYGEALSHSHKYFDYLIERARSQFPVRTPEGKVKALNACCRTFSASPAASCAMSWPTRFRIAWASIRPCCGRSFATPPVRVLPPEWARPAVRRWRMRSEFCCVRWPVATSPAAPVSDRDGQDLDFEPARQAHFALSREPLHEGSAVETLIQSLLLAQEQGIDPMSLPLEEADRNLLAAVLMDEREELTPELLESAIRSLKKRRQQHDLEHLQHQVKELESRQDLMSRAQLAQERLRLKQAMRSLGDVGVSDERS